MIEIKLIRYVENPIVKPSSENIWETEATFNPCVVEFKNKFIMLYRTVSKVQRGPGDFVDISSIGITESKDGINFGKRKLFFSPEYGYEAYGCEDPRISKFKRRYLVFYTAVSSLPPKPQNVRLALASTQDFEDYEKIGIVCPFNSKAGFIFPRKIKNQFCMMFTLYPDLPPSKLAVIYFDKLKDLRDRKFWENWLKYMEIERKFVQFKEQPLFVEVGSPPIETEEGWLLFIPDIIFKEGNFHEFRIKAILLDLEDPTKLIAISEPLLVPEIGYEKMGKVFPTTKIAMPTGALVRRDKIYVYYGASDLFCCLAFCDYKRLLDHLITKCRVW